MREWLAGWAFAEFLCSGSDLGWGSCSAALQVTNSNSTPQKQFETHATLAVARSGAKNAVEDVMRQINPPRFFGGGSQSSHCKCSPAPIAAA